MRKNVSWLLLPIVVTALLMTGCGGKKIDESLFSDYTVLTNRGKKSLTLKLPAYLKVRIDSVTTGQPSCPAQYTYVFTADESKMSEIKDRKSKNVFNDGSIGVYSGDSCLGNSTEVFERFVGIWEKTSGQNTKEIFFKKGEYNGVQYALSAPNTSSGSAGGILFRKDGVNYTFLISGELADIMWFRKELDYIIKSIR